MLDKKWGRRVPVAAWTLVACGGLVAMAVGSVVEYLSPLLLALIGGMILGNVRYRRIGSVPTASAAIITRTCLRVGVVLLGFQLPAQALISIGLRGVLVVLITVLLTYGATCLIGDRLGIEHGLVSLIASGFAICGAAAVAAVEGVVRRKDEDVATAITMVTLFGTLMIIVLPLLRPILGLTDLEFGVWVGASVHEVAQVVATAAFASATAVVVAMTVKLGRVALLGVAYYASHWRSARYGAEVTSGIGVLKVPWFLLGFLFTALCRSLLDLSGSFVSGVVLVTTGLLTVAMFGLGLGVEFRRLFSGQSRVLALSAASTGVAAISSLCLVTILY